MLNGDVAAISGEGRSARVDGIRTIANTAASDDHLYMLDDVRQPRWTTRTVLDTINSDERFSILRQILNHPSMDAKREELGSAAAELTFFAPTNEALAAFDMEQCEEPECSTLLGQFVGNHIVGVVVPRMFTPTKNLVTQSGSSLAWNFDAQNITCTGGDETVEELALGGFEEEYASNGIVQPIEALLCTEMDTCGDSRVTECAEEQQCGPMDDGCGGTIDCGFCGSGQNCVNHRCVQEDTNISAFFEQSAYGTHELLVFNIRCVSGNCQESKTQKMWENLATSAVEEAFFGDQPYSACSWYGDCSNDHFRFAPSSRRQGGRLLSSL